MSLRIHPKPYGHRARRVVPLLAVSGLLLAACGSANAQSKGGSSASTLPLLTTSCRIGNYQMPTQNEAGKSVTQVGEQVTVTDNWSQESAVEVTGLVVVFYDHAKEVGSVAAGAQEGTQNAATDLYPYPVYLTFQQSQTWTLAAGWTGSASRCTVVKVTSSPQVPQSQLGS
jgi:hypothetical protein